MLSPSEDDGNNADARNSFIREMQKNKKMYCNIRSNVCKEDAQLNFCIDLFFPKYYVFDCTPIFSYIS